MKKSILLMSILVILLVIVLSNNSIAASNRSVYVNYSMIKNYSNQYYTEIKDNVTDMGYACWGYKNPSNTTVIENMKKSDIFIASGHGAPGEFACNNGTYIVGKNMGSSGTYIALSTLPGGSLSNLKLAFWYSCNSGITQSEWGNLVDVTISKGAKCAVGWKDEIHENINIEWNRLFFEKVKSETIVEGFRHADYWLEANMGTAAKNEMQKRYEQGNIYQTLY